MPAGTNWTCPYCARPQTVTGPRTDSQNFGFKVTAGADGQLGLRGSAVVCANPDCERTTVSVSVIYYDKTDSGHLWANSSLPPLLIHRLLPESEAKPQPDYIPLAIREDYVEACRIRDLSPKASATLARRCLQGMIRDFCGVQAKTLFAEISVLKKAVEAGDVSRDVSIDSVIAIDNVRKVGNIGAHMEADVEHIVPVEAGEAQLLIDLIESLFDEWYVERQKRQVRFAAISAVAAEKEIQRRALISNGDPDAT